MVASEQNREFKFGLSCISLAVSFILAWLQLKIHGADASTFCPKRRSSLSMAVALQPSCQDTFKPHDLIHSGVCSMAASVDYSLLTIQKLLAQHLN